MATPRSTKPPPLAHNLCAMLQNGSRARLRRIPVPCTTQFANLAAILLAQGFVASVSRGLAQTGPDPAAFLTAPLSQRRLWIDLKYRQDQPVLRTARAVSKPSRRVHLCPEELAGFVAGRPARDHQGLVLGEICIVRGPDGSYYEGREALRARLEEAEVLCRVGS